MGVTRSLAAFDVLLVMYNVLQNHLKDALVFLLCDKLSILVQREVILCKDSFVSIYPLFLCVIKYKRMRLDLDSSCVFRRLIWCCW